MPNNDDFDIDAFNEQMRRNQELDKWRMMQEQTDLLREMSGQKTRPPGIKNWDWPVIGWCLLIFFGGLIIVIWYYQNS